MKLIFLGTGAAFTQNNYQSNVLVQTIANNKKKHLLIDCGCDIRHSLRDCGFGYSDIDALFISHLHSDHVGGVEWFSISTFFDDNYKGKPKLFINEKLGIDLWQKTLQGGLGSLQNQIANLDTYFDVQYLKQNADFKFQKLKLRTVQTIHYMDGYVIVPSFGLIIEAENGKKVFITTDTQFVPGILGEFYKDVDVIFHDCETAEHKSGVHAHYSDLLTLSPEIRAKMFLYHYQDEKLPEAEKDGFAGFVKKGQIFDF